MSIIIKGVKGNDFSINEDDQLCKKLAMLIEGQCTIGVSAAIKKYGYTAQHYYQLQRIYNKQGAQGLLNKKRGPEKQSVRTKEVVNQIIRLRFLDPLASAAVISQKLKQTGYNVSIRSVERTITEYGLQKKRIR